MAPLYATLASSTTTDYSRQLAFSQAPFSVLPCLTCSHYHRAPSPTDYLSHFTITY
jgi:hypothetical protein